VRAINKWAGASKKRAAEAEKNHKNKANERRLVSRWCTTRATASPTTRPLTVARRPPPSFLQAASGCLFPLAARPMGVATRVGQGGGSLGQPPYAHFTQAERVYFFFFVPCVCTKFSLLSPSLVIPPGFIEFLGRIPCDVSCELGQRSTSTAPDQYEIVYLQAKPRPRLKTPYNYFDFSGPRWDQLAPWRCTFHSSQAR